MNDRTNGDHPANLIAGNAATAVVSDGAGDTTRTDLRAEMCKALNCLYIAVEQDVARDVSTKVYSYVNALEFELDRLAGPPCDNPPCGGKRAIEHTREQLGRVCTFIDNPQDPVESWGPECGVLELDHINDEHDFQPSSEMVPHPPSPAVETWLRERGK